MYKRQTLDYTAQHLVQRPGDITIDGQAYSPNFYSTTENLDGYWQLRTHLSYGLPIGFLKSNFNVMAGVIYTKTPSMLGGTVDAATGMISGGERNDTKNMGYDFRAVLGSNISENVDFTLSWNGTYNEATNSLNADKSKNRYFNHTAQGLSLIHIYYTNSNVEKGRTFMWMFSMNTTLDYTAQHLSLIHI